MSATGPSTIGIGGVHDVGGMTVIPKDVDISIDQVDKKLAYWERSIHACLAILSTKKPVGLLTTDELRRAVEGLEDSVYREWGYYDKWAVAITTIMLERQVITQDELDHELNGDSLFPLNEAGEIPVLFKKGDLVRIRSEETRLRWRKPHLRIPGYIFGLVGKVNQFIDSFHDPFLLAFRGTGPKQPLYSVSFSLSNIWNNNPNIPYDENSFDDVIEADVYQEWMEPYVPPSTEAVAEEATDVVKDHDHDHHHAHSSDSSDPHNHDHHTDSPEHHDEHCAHSHTSAERTHAHPPHAHGEHEQGPEGHDHDHSSESVGHSEHDHKHEHTHSAGSHPVASTDETTEEHNHSHEHGHTHEGRYETECIALEREGDDTPGKLVGEALLRALYKKGITSANEIRAKIEQLDSVYVRMAGADLVVKCWRDPAFQARLLADGPAASLELGIHTSNPNAPTILRVYANSDTVHHVVVCTLCSCYPFQLLGYSPAWYKSRNYRSRIVREPRKVLEEFGTFIPKTKQIRVLDSTADCRYLVVPQPPQKFRENPAALAALTDEEVRALVTRDSMIGVTVL